MPSLIRFLVIVGLLCGIVYGAMLALVSYVVVTPRPMEEAIPASRLNK